MIPMLDNEIKRLAIGCLYLIYRRAEVNFPNTTKAHPSYKVVVQRNATSLIRNGDNAYFPYQVTWFIWETCIYPVLKSYWHRDLSVLGSFDDQIELIFSNIKNYLIKNGYYPDDGTYIDPDSLPAEPDIYPVLYGNIWWLRLQFKLPDDLIE
jgi:hypothetical protein